MTIALRSHLGHLFWPECVGLLKKSKDMFVSHSAYADGRIAA